MDNKRRTGGGPNVVWVPLPVIEDVKGVPTDLRWDGTWLKVESIESRHDTRQRMVTEEQVVKTHFELITTGGRRAVVFKNHVTGSWYLAN